jgi:4-amino-4-deoxy-L-arabinose transferase-like glycosyltransferase
VNPAAREHDSVALRPSLSVVLACAWPALLLATACLLPFLSKAFLIDDPYFLAMARQILKHPLHPMDFDICWNIVDYCTKAYDLTPGNTLMGYALVPTVLGGSAEWIAHVTQMAFAGVAIVAMTSLVLRSGWGRSHAIAGGVLLVAIPPFLPMASTAMPDVLATATALVAIERLIAWRADRHWHQGMLAAIALGSAGIARAHLVLLVPLAAFFLIESLHPREILVQVRRDLWLWAPVLVGGAILISILLATRERSLAINPPSLFSGRQNIPRNLRSYLLYFCFPLPLAAVWAVSRWHTRPRRIAYVLLAGAFIGVFLPGKLTGFLAAIGLGVLTALLMEAWKKRDQPGLFLMLWLLIPLPIVYYGHLPIKYLLPCMPALILTCFRLGESVPPRMARAGSVILIIGATIYSVLILRSDAEFAEFGRSAMAELILPHTAAGETVWYGGTFSAYWYAPLAGAKLYVSGSSQPRPGDLLVLGIQEGGRATLAHFPKRRLVQTVSHKYRFGRTMFRGKGLYTNIPGNWLWGFGDSDDDRFELWQIE